MRYPCCWMVEVNVGEKPFSLVWLVLRRIPGNQRIGSNWVHSEDFGQPRNQRSWPRIWSTWELRGFGPPWKPPGIRRIWYTWKLEDICNLGTNDLVHLGTRGYGQPGNQRILSACEPEDLVHLGTRGYGPPGNKRIWSTWEP